MTATAERRTKCLKFTAIDGDVVRIALHPVDLYMAAAAVTYTAWSVEDPTEYNAVLDGGAAQIDFTSVYDSQIFTRQALLSGKWDNATVHYFATDWSAPLEDEEPIDIFTLGKISDDDNKFTAELIGQIDKLNHTIGGLVSPLCGKVFANTHLDGEPIIANDNYYCKISAAAKTVTGTITSVDSATVFYDSARTEPDDTFGAGEIRFTTGNNAGLPRKMVSSYYLSGGQITANYPFYFVPDIGDAYEMIEGCRKRYQEDCVDKHDNGNDYGGIPHSPTKSSIKDAVSK